jgi:adenylate kinase
MAKKAATKKKAAPKKRATKKKVNKSQVIRDYCDANPDAGPTEVAAALKKQRINVSPAMVSTVKTMAKKKKGRGRKKAARGAGPASDKIALSSLITAKKMAESLGGIEKAQAALAALAKLQ